MRKEAGFEVMDRIMVYAKDNAKIEEVLTSNKEVIMKEVLANDITLGDTDGYVKDWNINGQDVTLGVKKQ